MFTVSKGYHWQYLTDQVSRTASVSYYTGAPEAGERPGRWFGAGAAELGLSGSVDPLDMEAVYGHFVDPRDPNARNKEAWAQAAKLGSAARNYRTGADLFAERVDALVARGASPEQLLEERWRCEKEARSAVSFLDSTYSPPKSVTVLWTALKSEQQAAVERGDVAAANRFGEQVQAVEQAVWDGFHAGVDYALEHAGVQRVGYHGTVTHEDGSKETVGRFVDAKRWVGAAFFQTTSRDGDPQLHIHGALLNRTPGPDGKWRTLHGKAIFAAKPGMSAVADRTVFESLHQSLGTEAVMREDGKSRELAGITAQERELYSKRRASVTRRTAQLVDAFEQQYKRAPNALELSNLAQKATKETRRAKSKGAAQETAADQVRRWTGELKASLKTTFARVAGDAVGRVDPAAERPAFDIAAVIEKALHEAQQSKSAWDRHDLALAIDRALPDSLGGVSPRVVRTVIEELTDRALATAATRDGTPGAVRILTAPHLVKPPVELQREDGVSQFIEPSSTLYATEAHMVAETELAQAATQANPLLAMDPVMVEAAIAAVQPPLSPDQAAAVRGVATSGRLLETILGPAGTGKSTAIGSLAEIWQDPKKWADGKPARRVFGLSTAEDAAKLLQGDSIQHTANIKRWLDSQDALAAGSTSPRDEEFRLRTGDLVVVDEAAMASTQALVDVQRYVHAAGAKMLFSGDYAQHQAVGAGGGMRLAAEAGNTYQLDQVWRFKAEWERQASLRLRDGNVEALAAYERNGRIHDGGDAARTADLAKRMYLAEHLAGRRTLLIVDTNAQAADLSAAVRQELHALGRVGEALVTLGENRPDSVGGGVGVGVGDIIQTRHNDSSYQREQGWGVRNRAVWRVTGATDGGGLRVQPLDKDWNPTGHPITLRPDYVQQHVALNYAVTGHGAQGKTVDVGLAVVTATTTANAAYPAVTRGVHANHMIVQTVDQHTDAQRMDEADEASRDRMLPKSPGQVLAQVFEKQSDELSATSIEEQSYQEARSLRTLGGQYKLVADLSYERRYGALADQMVADGTLPERHRDTLRGVDGEVGQLWRLLRAAELAGHDAGRVLRAAVAARELDTADSVPAVLHDRIMRRYGVDGLTPAGDSKLDRTPDGADGYTTMLRDLARKADARREQLGEELAAAQTLPAWALTRLGPVPADEVDRAAWTHRAGHLAGYREQYGLADEHDAIGPCPQPGQPEARADWHAAWRAIGAPQQTSEIAGQTDVELQARVDLHEREKAWAPEHLHDEQAATSRAALAYRHQHTLLAAQAEAMPAGPERDETLQAADSYGRLADTLDSQVEQLAQVNDARADWYLHTIDTRLAAQDAREELAARGRPYQEQPVKNLTWADQLAAEAAAMKAAKVEMLVGRDPQEVLAARAAQLEADRERDDAARASTEAAEHGDAERAQVAPEPEWTLASAYDPAMERAIHDVALQWEREQAERTGREYDEARARDDAEQQVRAYRQAAEQSDRTRVGRDKDQAATADVDTSDRASGAARAAEAEATVEATAEQTLDAGTAEADAQAHREAELAQEITDAQRQADALERATASVRRAEEALRRIEQVRAAEAEAELQRDRDIYYEQQRQAEQQREAERDMGISM